ncbi:hypothetical protein MA16_Dca006579 [Dendrobium catenatum]|uniref:Uncharacterized protein n=1 Tax=Dendrobium catenatum TaxID=906689 RepID=A0A2I0XGZ9_9ASPA|nr:hypothetical protein MA16_Dca006579 [Dendrobium catenatum]
MAADGRRPFSGAPPVILQRGGSFLQSKWKAGRTTFFEDNVSVMSKGSPLVIRENTGDIIKALPHVEGKVKSIAIDLDVKTPRWSKSPIISKKMNDLEASSSNMKIFCEQVLFKKKESSTSANVVPNKGIHVEAEEVLISTKLVIDKEKVDNVIPEDGELALEERVGDDAAANDLFNDRKVLTEDEFEGSVQGTSHGMNSLISSSEILVDVNRFGVLEGFHNDALECEDTSRSHSGDGNKNDVSLENVNAILGKGKKERCSNIIGVNVTMRKEDGWSLEMAKFKLAKELKSLGPLSNDGKASNDHGRLCIRLGRPLACWLDWSLATDGSRVGCFDDGSRVGCFGAHGVELVLLVA